VATPKALGIFSLAMINVAAIVSLRNLPLAAEYGTGCIFFYLLAAVCFLLPSALVCAELAAGWPQAGGVYRWGSVAFSKSWGFIGIWTAWMLSIVWFPTILSFSATVLAYAIDPTLAGNQWFVLSAMLIMLWGTTFINFLGMKASSWISTVGVLLGTFLPCLLLIGAAVVWGRYDMPVHLSWEWTSLIPEMRWSHWVFLAGIILGFEGMEITAYHVNDTDNPQSKYPKALALSTIFILSISILGSLSVASILPTEEIDLVAGVVLVFKQILAVMHMEDSLPLIAGLLFLGVVSTLNSWVIGPAKGILAAHSDGLLPNWLSKTNRQGVPVATLLFQAVIGSLLATCLLWLPSVQSFYWLFTLVSVQLTLIMYTLIFCAFLRLRMIAPDHPRPFRVPGRYGATLTAGLGLLTCLCIFGLGFVPPKQMVVDSIVKYELMLIGGLCLMMAPAYLCIRFKRKGEI
jgi:amino acid transporter